MKILMLLENNPYPNDSRVRREATTLAAAGHQVTVISPAKKGQRWYENVEGIHTYRFPMPPVSGGVLGYLIEYGYSLLAVWLLSIWVFFRRGFKVIHAHNPPDIFVLVAMPYKLLGKKFVFDHHDLSPEMFHERFGGKGNPKIHKVLLFLEKLSCRVANAVIATNQSYKLVQMERNGIAEEKITIVRNAPVLDSSQSITPAEHLRREGKLLIGYVGVMGVQDGVDYLLKALHHLKNDLKRVDFFAVLMGAGDALESLKTLTQDLGLNDVVLFTGWVQYADIAPNLGATDICVAPEPSNTYNDRSSMIKLTEYMAASRPIVAFDLPEHRFTAQDAAVYAKDNDPLEMAKLIQLLMDDPAKRAEMGRIGRQRIETELAWSFQAQNLIQLYEKLAR